MKKGIYYALCREYDTMENNYVLVEKYGMIDYEKNIAINKENGLWSITDLGTGLICTIQTATKKECLKWYDENIEKINRMIASEKIKPIRAIYTALLEEKAGMKRGDQ